MRSEPPHVGCYGLFEEEEEKEEEEE